MLRHTLDMRAVKTHGAPLVLTPKHSQIMYPFFLSYDLHVACAVTCAAILTVVSGLTQLSIMKDEAIIPLMVDFDVIP